MESPEGRVPKSATVTERVGLLIIRAWCEPGSSEPLRAQLRICDDVSDGLKRTLTLCRAEEVCSTVREWLAGVQHDHRAADGPGDQSPSVAAHHPEEA